MSTDQQLSIKPINPADKTWIEDFYMDRWGSQRVVTRGILYVVAELPGFIAWLSGKRTGLLTCHAADGEIEIITLDSLESNQGVGTALISECLRLARSSNCRRVWLITTNDNTPALRFYQKKGFLIASIHKEAVAESRKIKPEIPLVGLDGIPIRDEIELEYLLT
jgi:ribosomal protein S18 acetylase RimI-like enzyme